LTALVTKVIDKLFEAEGSSASHNSKELEGVER
jgi:hypothetical protein